MSWCMRLVKADFILHNIETNIKGLVFWTIYCMFSTYMFRYIYTQTQNHILLYAYYEVYYWI